MPSLKNRIKDLKLNKADYEIIVPFAIFLVLTLIIMLLVRINFFDSTNLKSTDQLISVPITTTDSSNSSIQIGVYIDNIYMLSISNKTFEANGWIWLTWPQKSEDFFQARKLTPNKWLNFVNQIDNWDFKLEQIYENPIKLKNGHYRQGLKFSGHFYIKNISFHKFPFETLKIPLVFELADFSNINNDNIYNMHLVPDKSSSGIGSYIDLTGYKTTAFNVLSKMHIYSSNYGSTVPDAPAIHTYQAIFETTYKQSINAALLTYFLPLLIVMALVLSSPMLSSSLWDVRLSVPPTALLSLIFLQLGYRENLPDLSYITFIDIIYNICYLTILLMFGFFLWGSNKINLAPDAEKESLIDKIDLMDKRFQRYVILGLIILITMNWMSFAYLGP
jgi:hypothetical protein